MTTAQEVIKSSGSWGQPPPNSVGMQNPAYEMCFNTSTLIVRVYCDKRDCMIRFSSKHNILLVVLCNIN